MGCEVQMIPTVYMNLELLERGDLPIAPVTIKQTDSLTTFKSHLKALLFPEPMISYILQFKRLMHCKYGFLHFLFIYFLLLFLLSACEFRFIERIGAHDKQNSRFYYYYYNIRWLVKLQSFKSNQTYFIFNSSLKRQPMQLDK